MDDLLMRAVFWPIQFLVENPWPSYAIASALSLSLLLTRLRHRGRPGHTGDWALLCPIVIWGVYAVHEHSLVGKGADIRVDLLYLAPLLYLSLVAGLGPWIRSLRLKNPAAAPPTHATGRGWHALTWTLLIWSLLSTWYGLWHLSIRAATFAWMAGAKWGDAWPWWVWEMGRAFLEPLLSALMFAASLGVRIGRRRAHQWVVRLARAWIIWLALQVLVQTAGMIMGGGLIRGVFQVLVLTVQAGLLIFFGIVLRAFSRRAAS